MKSYLPGFPVFSGCLPVAKPFDQLICKRVDLSLGAVFREIGLAGLQLPPLPFWKSLHCQLTLLTPISLISGGISLLHRSRSAFHCLYTHFSYFSYNSWIMWVSLFCLPGFWRRFGIWFFLSGVFVGPLYTLCMNCSVGTKEYLAYFFIIFYVRVPEI